MSEPAIKFKKRGTKTAPRKIVAPSLDSHRELSSDSEAEGGDGRVVKRRKTNSSAFKASTANQPPSSTFEGPTKYEADRSAVIEVSNDATKQSNWYDEDAPDSRGSTARQVGPQKASTNIRTITMTDYTPDVCKDYKQTGFCGFGDNCKFLHAREDYAAGWKLDKEWEMSVQGKKPGGTIVASANKGMLDKEEDGIDLAMLEKIPFACLLCKKSYQSPIVTKCNHYFCEACALKRYRKDPTCAACHAKTYGVFNGAKSLHKLLEKKHKWERKKKKEEEGEGEGEEEEEEEEEMKMNGRG